MYTAKAFAKKHGLQDYLDRPAELNEHIFNCLLLQEIIQLESARRKKLDNPELQSIAVRRVAYGKFITSCTGDERYRYAVETALKTATDILSVFQRKRFLNVLKSMGVPEDKIREFSDSVVLEDDTHCIDND